MDDLIAEYLQHLTDIDRAESTIETYSGILRRMDRDLPFGLESAHADELRDWINVGNRSKATRALYRVIAAGFFGWATNPFDPRLSMDPTQMLPTVRVPKRPARPVANAVLADILVQARPPFDVWLLIAAYGGARCTEIAACDREHITEEHILLFGKGDKARIVPTHPLIWAAVENLPPGPIATKRDGTRASRRLVSKRSNGYLHETLGHRRITIHMLRHWFGTHAYESSNDILAVKELLGHADVGTTQRYIQVGAAGRALAVAGLPRVA